MVSRILYVGHVVYFRPQTHTHPSPPPTHSHIHRCTYGYGQIHTRQRIPLPIFGLLCELFLHTWTRLNSVSNPYLPKYLRFGLYIWLSCQVTFVNKEMKNRGPSRTVFFKTLSQDILTLRLKEDTSLYTWRRGLCCLPVEKRVFGRNIFPWPVLSLLS